jgi:hypothetical protein
MQMNNKINNKVEINEADNKAAMLDELVFNEKIRTTK